MTPFYQVTETNTISFVLIEDDGVLDTTVFVLINVSFEERVTGFKYYNSSFQNWLRRESSTI